MKIKIGLLAIILVMSLLAGCGSDQQHPTVISREPSINGYEKVILENGLVILMQEDHRHDRVAMHIGVQLSPYDEFPDEQHKPGLNDVLFNLMPTGTGTLNTEQINNAFSQLGVYVYPIDQDDFKGFGLVSDSANLGESAKILFDILKDPSLTEDMLELIQNNYIKTLNSSQYYPESKLGDMFTRTFFRDTPLGTVTSAEDITSITREHLVLQHEAYVGPGRMTVSITGNFDTEVMVNNIRILSRDMPVVEESKSKEEIPVRPLTIEKIVMDDNTESPVLMIGYLISPSASFEDLFRLKLVSAQLNTRLLRLFREEKGGLAYSPRVELHTTKLYSAFIITVQTGPGKLEEVKTLTLEEIEKISRERITEAELETIKRSVKASIKMAGEVYEDENFDALFKEIIDYDLSNSDLASIINHLTDAQMISVADKYLVNPTIVMLDRND